MVYLISIAVMAGSFFLPWWWLILLGIGFGYRFSGDGSFYRVSSSAFLSGFFVWGLFSYYFDARSAGLISQRMAGLLGLDEPFVLYIITGLIGGIVLGLATWLGVELKSLLRNRPATL